MKAKVKNTGEIVDISPSGVASMQRTCAKYVTKDGREYIDLALEILPNIDWEQRRYEIAKETIAAFVASGYNEPTHDYYKIANMTVKIADILINELKKKKEE